MPKADAFLTSFGLTQGKTLAGYILTSAVSTHVPIKRYHEYRYDVMLTFKNKGDGMYENLFHSLYPYIALEHEIYGTRNLYRCVIDDPQHADVKVFNDGTIIFYLTGHCYREYTY